MLLLCFTWLFVNYNDEPSFFEIENILEEESHWKNESPSSPLKEPNGQMNGNHAMAKKNMTPNNQLMNHGGMGDHHHHRHHHHDLASLEEEYRHRHRHMHDYDMEATDTQRLQQYEEEKLDTNQDNYNTNMEHSNNPNVDRLSCLLWNVCSRTSSWCCYCYYCYCYCKSPSQQTINITYSHQNQRRLSQQMSKKVSLSQSKSARTQTVFTRREDRVYSKIHRRQSIYFTQWKATICSMHFPQIVINT